MQESDQPLEVVQVVASGLTNKIENLGAAIAVSEVSADIFNLANLLNKTGASISRCMDSAFPVQQPFRVSIRQTSSLCIG